MFSPIPAESRFFTHDIRYRVLRSLGGEEVDDRVRDCFVTVVEAICAGDLQEPGRLMGYVRTIVRRHIAFNIRVAIHRRRTSADYQDFVSIVSDWNNPEHSLPARQRAEFVRRVFKGVSCHDGEILRRFYLLEQTQDRICLEMGLSYNQFRLLKSRLGALLQTRRVLGGPR
jgi:DNA-directed RNA polymerase specialized sigma24 family protein